MSEPHVFVRSKPEHLDRFPRASKFGVGKILPPVDSFDWGPLCPATVALARLSDEDIATGLTRIGGPAGIAGALRVDPADRFQVISAAYHFGGLIVGFEAPESYRQSDVWDLAGAPKSAVVVAAVGSIATGPLLRFGGRTITMTWQAWRKYVEPGEVFAVVDPASAGPLSKRLPGALNWKALEEAFASKAEPSE